MNNKIMEQVRLLNTFVTYFNRTFRKKSNLFSDAGDKEYSTNYQMEMLYREILKNKKNPLKPELVEEFTNMTKKYVLSLHNNTQFVCENLVPLLLLVQDTYGDDLYNVNWNISFIK